MGIILFWITLVDRHVLISAILWIITLVTITWYYWYRRYARAWVVTIPSILGLVVHSQMTGVLIAPSYLLVGTSVLGGFIFCGSVFSATLGHQSVRKSDTSYDNLKRSVKCVLFFLVLRTVWDIPNIFIMEIDLEGSMVPIADYLQSFDGFFLLIALLFGTFIPIVFYLLTFYTIKIDSPPSIIGLLFVGVISIIIGNLFYTYYALQFSIFM